MPPKRVVVTGAGGKTGEIALRKFVERPDLFKAVGALRTEASAAQVSKKSGAECVVLNVTVPGSAEKALSGADVLVVLSSATPKPSYLKLLGVACQKYCCCQKDAQMGAAFGYPDGGMPEQVDWEGGRRLIEAAKTAGVKHVIYVGSMGGTKPDHFLNKMGGGNILLWKRKAEIELTKSGLPYTIIHPGGLLPHFGNKVVLGGERELMVGLDDELMDNPAKSRCIPREDVAQVVVQAALEKEAIGRAFDLVSHEPGAEGTKVWDKNLASLLGKLNGRMYSYEAPRHPIIFDN